MGLEVAFIRLALCSSSECDVVVVLSTSIEPAFKATGGVVLGLGVELAERC